MDVAIIKTCSRCAETKSVEDFPWKNRERGLRRSWCQSCQRSYSHAHYLANISKYKAKAHRNRRSNRDRVRDLVDGYLINHPCVDCGESDISLLEFDHREPALKRDPISRLAASAGWATVLHEIEKCDVRCANCHRQRTASQFDWAKTRILAKPGPYLSIRVVPRIDQYDAHFLKECCWCHWLKPLSEFAFRTASTGSLNSHCRKCQATYRRAHYVRHRARYFSQASDQTRRKRDDTLWRLRRHLLSHPCVDCGETNIATLDFDHVDPSNKLTEVGKMIGHHGWDSIQREIAKCVVRCANCHRRRTLLQAERRAPPLQFGMTRE